eukprot:15994359-Heterocapsa_arctica.AAC.2
MRRRAKTRERNLLTRRLARALSAGHLQEVRWLSRRLARTYMAPKKRQLMRAPPLCFELDEWASLLAKGGGAGGMTATEIWRGELAELPASW